MRDIYYTIFNGYYLSEVDFVHKRYQYSLNEDDRLWLSNKEADRVERLLSEIQVFGYARIKDTGFVRMLSSYLKQGVITQEDYKYCHKCL